MRYIALKKNRYLIATYELQKDIDRLDPNIPNLVWL